MPMDKHFKLILKDEGQDIYMPRRSQSWGYRYGPSIMVHNGICEAWFASPGDGYEADWFTYRRSDDGGTTWSEEKVVMSPVPDSMDWFSVCDPSVFKYGKYYYIGYTSTVFANGGGVCNNGFIARSTSPTGPFERWCGDGWGQDAPDGMRWLGKPAPVIYYDEDWHNWGAGEFSFVVKDDTLYIYYTWTSRDRNGKAVHETRVATADIRDENWPAHLTYHGVAVTRPRGSNDSYDMVYCEDLGKFVALSTDYRFTEDSLLAVYESEDGLIYRRVNEIKVHTGWMCHNCGISGDEQRHIRSGDTMLLAYAYGNQWGCWGTRMHRYSFEGMYESFYSEKQEMNVHHPVEKWEDPVEYVPTALYLKAPHILRMKVGESQKIPMCTMNVCYESRPAETGVKFSNYDKEVASIRCGKITARHAGMTYVTATLAGLRCEFPVYVYDNDPPATVPMRPYPEKKVVFFVPLIPEYRTSLLHQEMKQLRGLCTWSDGSWFELAGKVDGVTYINRNPELFIVDEEGHVLPTGRLGSGTVTLDCGGHSFDVIVTVVE